MARSLPSFARLTALSGALLVLALAPMRSAGAQSQPTYRLLFIGNSYTRFNLMPSVVQRALESLRDPPEVQVEMIAHPGWTLHRHWNVPSTRREIETGHFSHVVLQGHSLAALEHPVELQHAVHQFHDVIQHTGARTVLYETWARQPGAPDAAAPPEEMRERVATAYGSLAMELHALLAPAGAAFELANRALPELSLQRSDGSHPTPEGSYLAAITIASAVSGRDPREIRYRTHPMTRQTASALQEAAARALGRGPRRREEPTPRR